MTSISEFTIDRYDEVSALMNRAPGVAVREADSREATERYLLRNPSLSFIAEEEGKIIGLAMCGHDGRRGYLQHVIVAPECRGRGVADALVTRCLAGLEVLGIVKTHIDVFVANEAANRYWKRRGWKKRDDVYRYSMTRSKDENA